MDLTLIDFESEVDSKIVTRGRGYWKDGHVDTPEEREEGDWVAFVQGTDAYEVRVSLTGGQTTRYRCTCPYDLGPVCKHVVSVLYALRERLPEHAPENASDFTVEDQDERARSGKRRRKQKTVAERVDDALVTMPLETARELLRRVALDYPEVRVLLFAESTSADDTSTKADYKRIVQESARSARDQGGFIDYRGSFKAARGAIEVLDQAEALMEDGRLERAVSAYQAVIEGLTPVLQHADDSSGDIGGCVQSAFEGLQACAQQVADSSLRAELCAYCLRESGKEKYHGWGWEWEFLRGAGLLATSAKEVEKLFRALDSRVLADVEKGFDSRYNEERAAEIKLSALRCGTDLDAVEVFVAAHMHLPAIREEEIQLAYEDRRLEDVKKWAREGIRQSEEQRFPGLRTGWTEWLLRVAVDASDTSGIREYARELFLTGAQSSHYDTLREAYPVSEWSDQVDDLLRRVREQHRWHAGGIASQILIREERWEQLLELVSQRPSFESLDSHRKHLESRFPEPMVNLYSHVARAMLAETTSRATYQRACQLLRRIRSLGDEARVEELIEEFQGRYKRRRALMEELQTV